MILNLVIYTSSEDYYFQMYKSLSRYCLGYKKSIETYFVEYKQDLVDKYIIKDDILYIRGSESLIPGLIWKTIDALLILQSLGKKYRYVLRTNISSVIDFQQILITINGKPEIDYFAGLMHRLSWLDPASGIKDSRWQGTIFASGTLIGLSESLVNFILENRHKIRYDLVDDVAIGVFLKEYWVTPRYYAYPIEKFYFVKNSWLTNENVEDIYNKINPVIWRNKNSNRLIDVQNMSKIIEFMEFKTNNLAKSS